MTPTRINHPPALARRAWDHGFGVQVWELALPGSGALVLVEGRPVNHRQFVGAAQAEADGIANLRGVRARERAALARLRATTTAPDGRLPEPDFDGHGGPTLPSIAAVVAEGSES